MSQDIRPLHFRPITPRPIIYAEYFSLDIVSGRNFIIIRDRPKSRVKLDYHLLFGLYINHLELFVFEFTHTSQFERYIHFLLYRLHHPLHNDFLFRIYDYIEDFVYFIWCFANLHEEIASFAISFPLFVVSSSNIAPFASFLSNCLYLQLF